MSAGVVWGEGPAEGDPLGVSVHRLANGLTVYLSENHEDARIAARVIVRAGAAHDRPDATGTAHALEHMLANKGSGRLGVFDPVAERPHLDRLRALHETAAVAQGDQADDVRAQISTESAAADAYVVPNELKQAYGLLGARGLNAYTSHESTTYVVDLPAGRLDAWARLESDRFPGAVVRGFATEMQTIQEERNRALDKPERVLSEAISAALWPGHPYGQPVLGQVNHLQRPRVEPLEAFLRTRYVASDMAVVLAGDFVRDDALALIAREFGGWPLAPQPGRESAPAPLPAGRHLVEVTHRGQPEVRVVWRTVPRSHPDRSALVLVDMLLGNRATGLLDQRLVFPQRLRGAGAWRRSLRCGGLLGVWGRPRADQDLDEIEALLLEQVAALKDGDFSDETVGGILRSFEVGLLRRLEGNAGRVDTMGRAFLYDESWEWSRGSLDRVRAVTRSDIQRVAQRYLGADCVVGRRRTGEPDPVRVRVGGVAARSTTTGRHSPLFDEVMALPARALKQRPLVEGADYQRVSLAGGEAVQVRNPYSDLFQLRLSFDLGVENAPVFAQCLGLWSRAGAGSRDRSALESELFSRGLHLDAQSGAHSSGLVLAGPGDQLEPGLQILRERLAHPTLDRDEVADFLKDAVRARRERSLTRDFHVHALRAFALRGKDSAWMSEALSDERLLALIDEDVAARLRPAQHVAVRVGFAGAAVDLPSLLPGAAELHPPPPPAQRFVPEDHPSVLLLHHPAVQASVSLFIGLGQLPGDPVPELAVGREYLGGSAGLIFQEIRERRGLAYAASAGLEPGWRSHDDALAWAGVGCQSEQVGEVASLLWALMRDVPTDAARFTRARDGAVQQLTGQRVTFRSIPAVVHGWDHRGHRTDPRPGWAKRMPGFDLGMLDQLRGQLSAARACLAVVGDLTRIDVGALAALGTVREVRLADIVGFLSADD